MAHKFYGEINVVICLSPWFVSKPSSWNSSVAKATDLFVRDREHSSFKDYEFRLEEIARGIYVIHLRLSKNNSDYTDSQLYWICFFYAAMV